MTVFGKVVYRTKIEEIYFFYIAMIGFIMLYLLTEMQPRYAFIAAWIFIVLGIKNNNKQAYNYSTA